MLSAYLYRVRRAALKQPWKFIIVALFVLIFGFMMAYPTLMSMPNSDGSMSNSYVPRDPEVVTGGIYLILIAMFSFMFFTGIKNGVVGFSTADVIYHMAGPFTPRFNLIIAASGTMQICFVFTFLLATQTSLIYGAIGVSTADLLFMVCGSYLSAILGYFSGSYFGAKFSDQENNKKKVIIIASVVMLLLIASFAVTLLINNPDLKSLGIKGVVAKFGDSPFIKMFPGAGWVVMIYDGLINGSLVYSVAGLLLTAVYAGAIIFVYSRTTLDYYDEAIEYAQKAHDLAEQKRAGIDADTANMNKRAKVGNEKLGEGTGADALTSLHFLMNKRGSKFFFVNPTSVMYRIICAVYLVFMGNSNSSSDISSKMGDKPLIISAFMMMILLNAVLYAGGKTVMEFTKPFIYLIPEKSSKKLMACLKADIPEMVFDSVLCGIVMYFFVHLTLPESVAFGVMMIAFDLLSESTALLIMRLLPALGRQLLMFIRNLGTFFVAGLASISIITLTAVTGTLIAGIIAGAVTGAVLFLILLPVCSVVVERSEM